MSGEDTLQLFAAELAQALVPLGDAVASPQGFTALLREMGWDFAGPVPSPVAALAAGIADLRAALDLVLGGAPSPQELEDLGAAIRDLVGAVRELASLPPGSFPADLEAAGFRDEFPARLVQLLVVTHLQHYHPRLETLLRVLGIVRVDLVPAAGDRPAHVTRLLALPDLAGLLRDPGLVLKRVYGWGTADFRYQDVFEHVADLTASFGLDVYLDELDPRQVVALDAGAVVPGRPVRWSLKTPLFLGAIDGAPVEAGVGLFALPAQGAHLPGLSLLPYAEGELEERVELSERVSLVIEADADLTAGVGVVLRPGEPIDLLTDLVPSADAGVAPPSGGQVRVRLEVGEAGSGPTVLLAAGGVGRVEVSRSSLTGKVEVDSTGSRQLGVELELQGATLVIAPDEADSFVRSFLPADGLQAKFDLGLAWTNERGLTFSGAAGLDATLPVGISIGGVITIPAMHLGLQVTDAALVAEASASVGLSIGPIHALADRVGLTATLTILPEGGNLGLIDLDVGFKPPSRVGLAVDAAGLSGGGFVGLDPASGRYSGVLDLHSEKFGITALGLIDTKLPAGQSGYSLLLALRATFPAVQVGFGFALTGVGGLLALNRRVEVDVLRARLAAGTAGRVLAPQDPVRNAPALLADLDAVFPVAPGVTVVGPTVQLLWAELVHFDVGVFIELPGPARVVLLGSAHAEIERDGRAYLSIRVDVVGVVDLRGATAAFDAVLIDSHLMGTLDLTGGAALRMSWGAQPYAVLSLGGFNPAYHPEPLSFPATLARIAMVHGSPSDELYLRFEGYFAVTSNTLQFGASVEVAIHADPFTVHGSLGFDALIQFEPFHFQIDIRASVSLAYHSHTLAGLTLTGSLTGPGPVVLHAKVCIELLFFDICYSGTFTLGPSSPPPVPPVADLLDLLLAEAADPSRLRAAGAPDPYVRLTPPGPSLTIPVVAPTGALVWEQRRAPLDLLLTRVGGTPLPAPVQVSAAVTPPATATTPPATATAETDWFAPGQFTDLTDDQALTRPAYELLASGLRLAGTGTADGPRAQVPLKTKEILLPAKPDLPDKEAIMFPAWILTSATGPPAPAVTVTTETWVVATPAGERAGLTGAQARQLATMTTSARAVPAADRLDAFAF